MANIAVTVAAPGSNVPPAASPAAGRSLLVQGGSGKRGLSRWGSVFSVRYVAEIVFVAAGYFLLGKLGLQLGHTGAAASWPPAGLAIAAPLILGYRIWPAILLGACFVGFSTGAHPALILATAAGNTFEGLLGAWLTNRFAGGIRFYEQATDLARFTILAGVLSPLMSPPMGVAEIGIESFPFWTKDPSTFFICWLGESMSVLTVTPLVVVWSRSGTFRVHWPRVIEFGGLLLSLILVSAMVFGPFSPVSGEGYLLPHLCLPFSIWAAFRFGCRGTTLVSVILGSAALWGTIHGYGFFARIYPHQALMAHQGFVAFCSVLSLSVAALVAERRETERALSQMLGRVVDVQENERGRISRELHDQMGQELNVLKMGLGLVKGTASLPAEAHQRLGALEDLTSQVIRSMHRLAWELRPPALDDFGIAAAIERYVLDWSKHSGVSSDFQTHGMESLRLPPRVETTLFRLTQEALNNVLKHAKATQVSVVLERRPGDISLIIEDNGVGFDEQNHQNSNNQPSNRLGLLGMRERVALLEGTISFESSVGKGTVVYMRLPFQNKTDGSDPL